MTIMSFLNKVNHTTQALQQLKVGLKKQSVTGKRSSYYQMSDTDTDTLAWLCSIRGNREVSFECTDAVSNGLPRSHKVWVF